MHESDVMAAAVHAVRASPPRFQTLAPPTSSLPHHPQPHPHPHPLPSSLPPLTHHHPYSLPLGFPHHEPSPLPALPFTNLPLPRQPHPLPPTLPPLSFPSRRDEDVGMEEGEAVREEDEDVDDDDDDEDVDEDDMSGGEEEMLKQQLEAFRSQRQQQREVDVTRQLLQFAASVSCDVQRLFSSRRGEEDWCDVYEDKWGDMTKSGRELYYHDLLKMAQGDKDDKEGGRSKNRSRKNDDVPADNRHAFSGRVDVAKGLGGLRNLFDLTLNPDAAKPKANASHAGSVEKVGALLAGQGAGERSKAEERSSGKASQIPLPMSRRSLPESFWREPGLDSPDGGGGGGGGGGGEEGINLANADDNTDADAPGLSLLPPNSSTSSSSSSNSSASAAPVMHSSFATVGSSVGASTLQSLSSFSSSSASNFLQPLPSANLDNLQSSLAASSSIHQQAAAAYPGSTSVLQRAPPSIQHVPADVPTGQQISTSGVHHMFPPSLYPTASATVPALTSGGGLAGSYAPSSGFYPSTSGLFGSTSGVLATTSGLLASTSGVLAGLGPSQLPDFSDLVDSWGAGDGGMMAVGGVGEGAGPHYQLPPLHLGQQLSGVAQHPVTSHLMSHRHTTSSATLPAPQSTSKRRRV